MNPLEAIDTLRTKLAHNTRDYRPEDHAIDVLDKFFKAIKTEPAVVLVNMVRGFIAKPSPLSIAGLYGPVIGDIERANLDIAELRARLADWDKLFAAVVGQNLPNAPSLWPFDGEQDPAMVAFTIHQLRARIAEFESAPVVAYVNSLSQQAPNYLVPEFLPPQDRPPIGTELIARPAKD